LSQHDVVRYLLERKLVTAASIVAGDLSIEQVPRRNRNFKVMSRHGSCFFLKQGIDQEGKLAIAHEAAIYQLLRSDSGAAKLDRYLPQYYGYDPQTHILILELFSNAQDLRAYHARCGRFSTALAAALGKALAILHRLAWDDRDSTLDDRLVQPIPWVFSLNCPEASILQNASGANLEMLRLIQHSAEFCRQLEMLGQGWRAEALIHNDFKWDNCVILAQPIAKRQTRLKIIDWEFSGIGDPCWDVGGVFSSYLSFWLLSIPFTGSVPPDRFMELARYPLHRMQPAIRTYWWTYAREMGLDEPTSERWLLRAMNYAAARLMQTAFEQTHMSAILTGEIICLLQLSLNIMKRPHLAIDQLLGIPLRPTRPE
jgi:hypothetical protein